MEIIDCLWMMLMNIIDYLNDYSGILSLFSSIILTIVIFVLERKHQKKQDKESEKNRKLALYEAAKVFIIDNDSEIEYLPLCVIAASVSKFSKNKRKIFNRFKRCSAELQGEILQQEKIPLKVTDNNEWVNEYMDNLTSDAQKNKLGNDIFYDGAKYFHRALERYANYSTEDVDTYVFSVPQLSDVSVFRESHQADFTLYIDHYLEFVLQDQPDTKNSPELLPHEPPYDYLWEHQSLGSCDEPLICFWEMNAVISTCIAFFRHRIVGQDNAEWRQVNSGNAKIETFEDLYYEALLNLYTAYAPNASLSE
jgi:hypothetical protein